MSILLTAQGKKASRGGSSAISACLPTKKDLLLEFLDLLIGTCTYTSTPKVGDLSHSINNWQPVFH